MPRVDISGQITDALLSELADKNWKVREERFMVPLIVAFLLCLTTAARLYKSTKIRERKRFSVFATRSLKKLPK